MKTRIEITDGYYLSSIGLGDKSAYVEHFADPEIADNLLAVPFPYREADADWWIAHYMSHAREPETMFAIRESSGFLIGAIGFMDALTPDSYRAEFGYWLAKAYRGRGIMPAVIRGYSCYAFEQLGLRRLYATPFSRNVASHRALEKAGFEKEGYLRQHHRKGQAFIDAVLYVQISPNL